MTCSPAGLTLAPKAPVPIGGRFVATLRDLERLLLPNSCIACDRGIEPTEPDALMCRVCRSRLRPVDPGCARCRQPLPPVGPCRFCADWPPALQRVDSAVWLGDEARSLIHHLKYEGYADLARLASQAVVARLPRSEGCLVPVPLGPARLRQRGYNQSTLIARNLASAWDLPVVEAALRRVRETDSQTALTPDLRRLNVAAAFKSSPPGAELHSTAVLVDDVMTTGATLAAAATALAGAGWTRVTAITFARAFPFVLRAASI